MAEPCDDTDDDKFSRERTRDTRTNLTSQIMPLHCVLVFLLIVFAQSGGKCEAVTRKLLLGILESKTSVVCRYCS